MGGEARGTVGRDSRRGWSRWMRRNRVDEWVERARRACIARAQYIRVIIICRCSRDQYQPEVGSANANNPYCWCLHSTASREPIHLVSKFRIASSSPRPPTDPLYPFLSLGVSSTFRAAEILFPPERGTLRVEDG